MIAPTEGDIGRRVAYNNGRGVEDGRISSLARQRGQIDKRFVFVRFRGPQGELTPCDKLEWLT